MDKQITYDKSQLAAIELATETPFRLVIITGGAGTGKTTIIKAICERLESKREQIHLCAFAGKAAARIREATGREASTIHRMLGYDGMLYRKNTLAYQTVIIDESSMIDSALMAEITRRKPKRLILVGDQAQLPPVGRAQPFHDLIRLLPDKVYHLTTCHRAKAAILQAATAIRQGEQPEREIRSDTEMFTMTNTGGAVQTQAKIMEWVKAGIFDFDCDVILVCRNGESDSEPCTVRGLNSAIVDAIAPREDKRKFQQGDRVINTHNIPAKDVWNGTTGTVHAVDQDGAIWVRTDTSVMSDNGGKTDHVLFARDEIKHLQYAYALTTHKSQGSEYRRVCVVCLRRDLHCMMDRRLLYTAVTRAKEGCVVVGEIAAVRGAVMKMQEKKTVMQATGTSGGDR